MSDDFDLFGLNHAPDPDRPLLGRTVLVVEDSRFASEAIRLLCLRSGARIRRADSLAAARRHLRVYRPSVVIVDLGLPDGSGADLIGELAQAGPRVGALLGMSGDPAAQAAAMDAGADGFLPKPIESLAMFQTAVMAQLPSGEGPALPRALPSDVIEPDRMALRDDLAQMAEMIDGTPEGQTLDYVAQFLSGVARTAQDGDLEMAAANLARSRAQGRRGGAELARVAGLLQDRLGVASPV